MAVKALYTDEITAIIRRDQSAAGTFLGVFPREQLPTIHTLPSSLIGNTHHSSRPGEHWVAFYFDEHGHGEYFDSFGLPPAYLAWEDYLDSHSQREWFYMNKTVQDLNSNACGYYAMLYIMLRSRGMRPQDILHLFSSSHLIRNDLMVLCTVNKIVNPSFSSSCI